jgi:Tol biopolymer transport system component
MRRQALLLGALLLVGTGTAQAQYFGQNKVNYQSFDFQVLKTEHFDFYYYPEEKEAAIQASRMAERWYARLSRIFNHQLNGRQPLIFYASAPHFQQTNAILGGIGEGTGGVTEALRRRIVLPSAGPLAETDHVIGHELVHAFQFDLSSGKGQSLPVSLRLPLWFIEGMAEYLSIGPVDPHTAMWVRDALRGEQKLPAVKDLDNPKYFPYRWGQAFWAYVGGRWGDDAVAKLMKSAAKSGNVNAAIKEVLSVKTEDLSKDWQASLRSAYGPFLEARQPASHYGKALVTEKNAGELNLAPSLSPDGKRVVFLSERDQFSIDFFLADAETGRVIRRIYSNATDPHLDSLQFIQSAGDWNAAGDRFAFAGVEEGRALLGLLDPNEGGIVRRIPLKELDQIFDPAWSPDGRSIVLSGQKGGLLDLYVYDLEGGTLRRLTQDPYAELQPAWSPDGARIAFATDRFSTKLDDLSYGNYRLATVDPNGGNVQPLAMVSAEARHSDPQWSADGRSLFFVSDANGASNVWRLELAESRLFQVTDLATGVSGITPLSPALSVAGRGDRMVAAVREDGKYRIYRMDGQAVLAGTPAAAPVTASTATASATGLTRMAAAASVLPPLERRNQEVVAFKQDDKTGLPSRDVPAPSPYRPQIGLEFAGSPTIEVGTSSRYGNYVGGSTALSFSDMLGNHRIDTAFNVNGRFRDIGAQAVYTNLKSRWNWGAGLQHVPYLTGGAFFQELDVIDGIPVVIDTELTQRQTETGAFGFVQYPFNRAFRFESSLGYRRIGLRNEIRRDYYSYPDGQFLDFTEEELPSPAALNLAEGTAALVYDTSVFGATSPILGRRFRIEASPTAGTINYTGVLADFRQYFMPVRPLTFAFRAVHYGRYGGGAEDERFPDLYLGYPDLVRGYDSGSFDASECEATAQGTCAVFDRLLGSKVLVGNAELRFPLSALWGSRRYGPVPIELAAFADAGVAWARGSKPEVFGGERRWITSVGAAARVNVLGFLIVEADLVRPLDRPNKGWIWQFNFMPGF